MIRARALVGRERGFGVADAARDPRRAQPRVAPRPRRRRAGCRPRAACPRAPRRAAPPPPRRSRRAACAARMHRTPRARPDRADRAGPASCSTASAVSEWLKFEHSPRRTGLAQAIEHVTVVAQHLDTAAQHPHVQPRELAREVGVLDPEPAQHVAHRAAGSAPRGRGCSATRRSRGRPPPSYRRTRRARRRSGCRTRS